MATYTYLLYDLVTNALVTELPLSGVTFNTSLNKVGQLNGTIPVMSDPGVTAAQLASAIVPGRQALYVDRGGVIVWGGVLWQAPYKRSSDSLQVTANTFGSYFARRRLRVDSSTLWTNPVDQLAAAQGLINYAQSVRNGNVNVAVPATTSGVMINAIYNAFERRGIMDEIDTLSQAANGFDYGFDCAYNGSHVPIPTFNLGYPRRGRVAGSTGLLFENPGNVLDYDLMNDASKTAFTVDVTAANTAGNAGTPLIASSSVTAYLDAGWPQLDDVVPYKGANDSTLMAQFATAQAASLGQPLIMPSFVVDPGADPVLGSYIEGDEARFRLNGPMFAGGSVDTYYRIIDIAVTPGEGGTHESATLTVGPVLGY